MPNIDAKWVVEQLQSTSTPVETGDAIVALLQAWSKLEIKSSTVQKDVIMKFSKLALGRPLRNSLDEEDGVWVPAMPGRIKVGDEVLVKEDAFTGELGVMHNGRRGRVVAVRYGDIIVNSTDGKSPDLNGTHYGPAALMKLEKRA